MDALDIDRIKHVTNTETIRRLLVRYFIDKGFKESFDRPMYPSLMQDLPLVVPSLNNKIEIVPHAIDIDMSMGRAIIGWNLFALGNQRLFLGETYHNDLHDLARQIKSGLVRANGTTARKQTTPRRAIAFIIRVLEAHAAGYVDLSPPTRPVRSPGEPFVARQTMAGMPQQFFSRSGMG